MLYALAGVVAFAAVFGAWFLGSRWLKKPEEQAKSGYLALVTLTAPGSSGPVAAALVVKDAAAGASALYVIPRELLLEGPNGEYVFAGDAMAAGTSLDAAVAAAARISLLDLIGRGRGVVANALALYNENHAGN